MSSSAVFETEGLNEPVAPKLGSAAVRPEIRIETLDSALPPQRRSLILPISAALHVAVLFAVIVVPLLSVPALPEPATGTKAFFAEPLDVAPPPPPPPPPAPAQVAARAQSVQPPTHE
jgi:hypothetical protein